jgi:hypothetical protein
MIRYARTYGSQNYPENVIEAWQYPTGPIQDTFGVPVLKLNRSFGLEEFNFNPFFLEEKMAYVPCYATKRYYQRPALDELRLIFNVSGHSHIHYATLYGVSAITDTEIPNLRALINPFFNEVYLNSNVQNFFGNDFDNYKKIISRMYLSEIIAANNIHSPFLINVRYERLELLKNPIACRVIPNNVNQWKTNVHY